VLKTDQPTKNGKNLTPRVGGNALGCVRFRWNNVQNRAKMPVYYRAGNVLSTKKMLYLPVTC